jgi:hypothetical protein
MDDIILIIFASFALMLLLVGFFKKQVLLSIFSGIGFVLIGVFLLQGVTYVTDATFTDSNWTTTQMVEHTAVWHSIYATPLFIFFTLFGLTIIVISVLEYMNGRKIHPTDRLGDESDEEG